MSSGQLSLVGWSLGIAGLLLFFASLYFFDSVGVGLGFIAGGMWVSFRWTLDYSQERKREEQIRERKKNLGY